MVYNYFMDRDTVYFYIPERKLIKFRCRMFSEFYFFYVDDEKLELILEDEELIDVISLEDFETLTSLSK